jgi:tetratricopeptide (TPR) repeat protein
MKKKNGAGKCGGAFGERAGVSMQSEGVMGWGGDFWWWFGDDGLLTGFTLPLFYPRNALMKAIRSLLGRLTAIVGLAGVWVLTEGVGEAMTGIPTSPKRAEVSPPNVQGVRVIFSNTTINGKPVQVNLDTGAEMTIFLEASIKQLGLQITPPAPANKPGELGVFPGLTEPVTLAIGAQTFTVRLPVFSVPPNWEWGVAGSVGWPEVRDNILVFDGDKGTVTGVDQLPGGTADWQKLPVRKADVLLLDVQSPGGNAGSILVDTGSPHGVALPPAQWMAWRAAHPRAPSVAHTDYTPDAGEVPMVEAWADEIKVGPLTLTDVPVREMNAADVFATDDLAGALGMYALARMELVVDAKGGFAYVRPKAGPGPAYAWIKRPDASRSTAAKGDWQVAGDVRLNSDKLQSFAAMFEGVAKAKKGDYAGAVSDYTQALKFDPQSVQLYANRGALEADEGKDRAAIADFTQAIALDPKNADAYGARAQAKEDQGDYDGAIADYTQSLKIDPRNLASLVDRGLAELDSDNDDGAIADFNRALAIAPGNVPALLDRGLAKGDQGDYDGARADFTRAQELDPKNAEVYLARSQTEEDQKDYDGAIADDTYALKLDPKNIKAYVLRGYARFSQGDYDGALADYSQALALDPKSVAALIDRGQVKQRKGDHAGAIADYSQAIALDPKKTSAHIERGIAEESRGNFAAAVADFDQAIALKPDEAKYPRLYREVAQLRLGKGKTPPDFAQEVAGWKDGWSKLLGQYLAGELDEAALLAAAQKKDEEPVEGRLCEAYYFIGMKRLLAGDTAAARDFWQKSLATGKKSYYEYEFALGELARTGSGEGKK